MAQPATRNKAMSASGSIVRMTRLLKKPICVMQLNANALGRSISIDDIHLSTFRYTCGYLKKCSHGRVVPDCEILYDG